MSNLKFNKIKSVEFGICIKSDNRENLYLIPSDIELKESLKGMLNVTLKELNINSRTPMETYEPSQKYPKEGCLKLALEASEDSLTKKLKLIFDAENIPINAQTMKAVDNLLYYFCIFRNDENKKLMGFRKASQFKGIVKAKNRLVRLVDDTLKIVPDTIFKLDKDFDFVIFDENVYIYRPVSFEQIAEIEEEILKRAEDNIGILQGTTENIDFISMRKYVSKHIRAARLVAAIKMRDDIDKISKKLLKEECKKQKIILKEEDGRISVPKKNDVIPFLQVIDRRRYTTKLISRVVERYKALYRVKVK